MARIRNDGGFDRRYGKRRGGRSIPTWRLIMCLGIWGGVSLLFLQFFPDAGDWLGVVVFGFSWGLTPNSLLYGRESEKAYQNEVRKQKKREKDWADAAKDAEDIFDDLGVDR